MNNSIFSKSVAALSMLMLVLAGCTGTEPDDQDDSTFAKKQETLRKLAETETGELPEGITLGEPIQMSGEEFQEFLKQQASSNEQDDGIFLYVKLPGVLTPVVRNDKFAAPIGEALEAASLGEVTGGGTMMGAKPFSGIDVVVSELDQGLEVVAKALQDAGAPKGTEIRYTEDDEKKVKVVVPEDLAASEEP